MQKSSNQGGRKDSLPRGKTAWMAEGFLIEIVETSEEWTAPLKLKYRNCPQPRIPSLTKLSFRSRGETKMCSGAGRLRGLLPARQLWKDDLSMEEHGRLGTSGRRNRGRVNTETMLLRSPKPPSRNLAALKQLAGQRGGGESPSIAPGPLLSMPCALLLRTGHTCPKGDYPGWAWPDQVSPGANDLEVREILLQMAIWRAAASRS